MKDFEKMCVDGVIYTVNESEAEVVGSKDDITDLVIRDSYDGYKVTSIAKDAFRGCEMLESVTIPGSIKRIEMGVFSFLKSLKNVKIMEGVEVIDDNAFWCSNIENITIPNSIKNLGDIFGITNHKHLNYYEYDNGYYIGNDDNPFLVLVKAKDQKVIEKCEINEKCRFILPCAFLDCPKLKSIHIPKNIIQVGYSAFSDCTIYCKKDTDFTNWDKEWCEDCQVIYE